MAPRNAHPPRTDREDYIEPGSDQHRALLGYEDATPERREQLDRALAEKTLRWVGREKTPIGPLTVPGELLIEGFRRRKP